MLQTTHPGRRSTSCSRRRVHLLRRLLRIPQTTGHATSRLARLLALPLGDASTSLLGPLRRPRTGHDSHGFAVAFRWTRQTSMERHCSRLAFIWWSHCLCSIPQVVCSRCKGTSTLLSNVPFLRKCSCKQSSLQSYAPVPSPSSLLRTPCETEYSRHLWLVSAQLKAR